jgi:hypothetical protein
VIHLYAFSDVEAPLPSITGIDGGRLEACTFADVAAVVSVVEGAGAGRDAVVAHGWVVEGLRELTDAVLPVRFGERFVDGVTLRDAVVPRLAALRAGLARVRGCAEFGVRLLSVPTPEHASEIADGTSYMRARLSSVGQAEAVAAELHEPLARCARETVVRPGADHAAAYLVPDGERVAFERALAGFTSAHPGVTVVCTGPWAPYSFAEAA